MKQVVFILGTGHCGSTLLDLLLGSHSKMASLGEVHRTILSHDSQCFCDLCENNCVLWKPELFEKLKKTYQVSFIGRGLRKIGLLPKSEIIFYNSLMHAFGKHILIDSSKNPGWISRNGNALNNSNKFKPILIYLSRDGRAVVNSYYRKYPERGIEKIAHNWNNRINSINKCYDSWPNESKVQIRYEDLAQNPERVMSEIVNFLGLSFEPDLMRFWEHDHHLINGNSGTKSMVLKFRDAHRFSDWIVKNEKTYYKNQEFGIQFDERWKDELDEIQLKQVNTIICDLNKSLIYKL